MKGLISRVLHYQPPPGAALLVAIVALAVAVVGTASGLPGKGQVKKNDYAKKSIPGKAFKNKSIPERAYLDASIPGGAFKTGSIPISALAGPIPLSALGSDVKSAFLGSRIIVRTDQTTLNDGSAGVGTSQKCNSGETPIGGGAFQSIGGVDAGQAINATLPRLDNMMLNESPNGGPVQRWGANGINETGGDITLRVFVLCAVNVP